MAFRRAPGVHLESGGGGLHAACHSASGKIVWSGRAEERAVSLSLQYEPVRPAQGTGRQRSLQSTRGHRDSCRFGGRVLHRNRPCSNGRADTREPSSRKLLCDPALRSPKKRRPVNTRYPNVADRNRAISRRSQREARRARVTKRASPSESQRQDYLSKRVVRVYEGPPSTQRRILRTALGQL